LITSFGIKKHGDAIGGVHINSEKKGYKAATKQMVAIFASGSKKHLQTSRQATWVQENGCLC
jgi:hypothetical protein